MVKHLDIDGDSILYASAFSQQTTQCVATHNASGREKTFKTKTEFNKWLIMEDKWKSEDFTLNPLTTLKEEESFDGELNLRLALSNVKRTVQSILSHTGASTFNLVLEGEGNFRNERKAKWMQYKSGRGDKPVLFTELKEMVCDYYSDVLQLAVGVETDDIVCMKGWRAYNSPHVNDVIIAYKDKDIPANTVGCLFNYSKNEHIYIDELKQRQLFAIQLLMGDACDSVPGIEDLTDDVRVKYGLSKRKGVGVKTAEKLIEGVSYDKLIPHTLSIYQDVYGEQEGWERMDENGFFLYLLKHENDFWDLNRYV